MRVGVRVVRAATLAGRSHHHSQPFVFVPFSVAHAHSHTHTHLHAISPCARVHSLIHMVLFTCAFFLPPSYLPSDTLFGFAFRFRHRIVCRFLPLLPWCVFACSNQRQRVSERFSFVHFLRTWVRFFAQSCVFFLLRLSFSFVLMQFAWACLDSLIMQCYECNKHDEWKKSFISEGRTCWSFSNGSIFLEKLFFPFF